MLWRLRESPFTFHCKSCHANFVLLGLKTPYGKHKHSLIHSLPNHVTGSSLRLLEQAQTVNLNMSFSQDIQRVFLVLLLPLYARSTSIPHIVLHGFIVTALTFIITLTARKFRPVVAAAAAVAVVWSWCANHIANYALMGEWKRIIFGYAVAYEALYRLLPVKINIYQWILDEFVEEYTNMLRNQLRRVALMTSLVSIHAWNIASLSA
jgi:hypothetical protein